VGTSLDIPGPQVMICVLHAEDGVLDCVDRQEKPIQLQVKEADNFICKPYEDERTLLQWCGMISHGDN